MTLLQKADWSICFPYYEQGELSTISFIMTLLLEKSQKISTYDLSSLFHKSMKIFRLQVHVLRTLFLIVE